MHMFKRVVSQQAVILIKPVCLNLHVWVQSTCILKELVRVLVQSNVPGASSTTMSL